MIKFRGSPDFHASPLSYVDTKEHAGRREREREHFMAQSAPSAPRSQNRPYGMGKRECVLVNHEEVGMRHTVSCSSGLLAVATLVAVLLAWPMAGAAQTVTGEASGVRATGLGT